MLVETVLGLSGIAVALALVAVPAFLYLVLPLIVRAQWRIPARPAAGPLDPADLDAADGDFLTAGAARLARLGFSEVESFRVEGFLPDVTLDLVTTVRRGTGDEAAVIVIRNGGVAPSTTRYAAFSTGFESGDVLTTHNNSALPLFAPGPVTHAVQVPGVADLAELGRLHVWVVERRGLSGPRETRPAGGAIEAFVGHDLGRVLRDQVAAGRMAFDEDDEIYTFTLLGVYLAVWGQLPPYKQLRAALIRRRGRRLVREFRAAEEAGA